MPTKLNQIKYVFSEFKRESGHLYSDAVLLEKAEQLVEIMNPAQSVPKTELRTGGVPFDQYGLDVAMSDGGWRIMARESHLVSDFIDEDRDGVSHDLFIQDWLRQVAA